MLCAWIIVVVFFVLEYFCLLVCWCSFADLHLERPPSIVFWVCSCHMTSPCGTRLGVFSKTWCYSLYRSVVVVSCYFKNLLVEDPTFNIAIGLIKLYVQSMVVVCKLLIQHSFWQHPGKYMMVQQACSKLVCLIVLWSFCKLTWLTWQIIYSKFVAAAWMTTKVSIEQLVYGIYLLMQD